MAKTKRDPSTMEFEFFAADLERLLASKPKKVLFTVWVQTVKTDRGEKVGALRIKATVETLKKIKTRDGGAVYGGPKPPGIGI
jgi:hypothetical protein